MVESITKSNLYNSFAVFREVLKSISALTALSSKWSSNDRYFEDEPNPKNRNFIGYPYMLIETNLDDEHLTFTGLKQMNFTTNVTIRTEYFAERETARLNSYMNAITNHFNTNQTSLLNTYGLDGIRVSQDRDRDEIAENQLVVGILTFDYNVKLDVEN